MTASDPLSSPPLRFHAGSLAWKTSKTGSDMESGNNSATKRCPSSAAISTSSNFNSPSSVYTLSHRSLPSRHQPRRRLVPGTAGLIPGLVPTGLCRHRRRFCSRPHHLFNVFFKVRHRKISQCSPDKVSGRRFEYTAYTRNFEKSLHLTRTLAARCPNAKLVYKNSLCFME